MDGLSMALSRYLIVLFLMFGVWMLVWMHSHWSLRLMFLGLPTFSQTNVEWKIYDI